MPKLMLHLKIFIFIGDIATEVSTGDDKKYINKMYLTLYPFKLSSTLDVVGSNKGLKRVVICILQIITNVMF